MCFEKKERLKDTTYGINFVPQYNLEKGVYESVKWYKEHGWLK